MAKPKGHAANVLHERSHRPSMTIRCQILQLGNALRIVILPSFTAIGLFNNQSFVTFGKYSIIAKQRR